MNTIRNMYPMVKSTLGEICEAANQEMKFYFLSAHKFHLDFDGGPIAGRISETPGSTT